ncbi:MAG: LptE family protein [Planctomycetota bacterium]
MRRVLLGLMAVLIGFASAGCSGYAFESPYRGDVQSIAVPILGNNTFAYGLEAELTDALIKEIHRTTPYKVLDQRQADTVLSGTIVETDLRKLVGDSETGLVQELAVTIVVSFDWKDAETGRVLLSRRGFEAADVFVPDRDAGERIETGRRRTVDRLAKDMVAEMRSAW